MIDKFLLQLVNLDDSTRSEPFALKVENIDGALSALDESIEKTQDETNYGVIVIAEHSGDDMNISQAPIMALGTFKKVIKEKFNV